MAGFMELVADRTRGHGDALQRPFGLQRLYYHEAKDAVYFAAEAKAILKVRPELRAVDARGLAEFVTCGCVLENRTLFSGIHVLASGIRLGFFVAARSKDKAAYFDPREWEEQERLEPEEYYSPTARRFRTEPCHAISMERARRRISLTGGLDTRIIMAWHKAQPNSLPCYTFGSMYRDNRGRKIGASRRRNLRAVTSSHRHRR